MKGTSLQRLRLADDNINRLRAVDAIVRQLLGLARLARLARDGCRRRSGRGLV